MNTAIKILLLLTLLTKVTAKVRGSLQMEYVSTLTILSYLFFIAAIVLLTWELGKKYPIYSAILVLEGLAITGLLLKNYHVAIGAPLMVLGLMAEFLFVFTLLRNKLLRTSIFHLLLGLSFLVGWLLLCLELSLGYGGEYAKLVSYPIAAFSATLLLNKQAFNQGEKNVLIFVCVQGLVFIMHMLWKSVI